MAYDPARGKLVLFGGSDDGGVDNETWTLRLATANNVSESCHTGFDADGDGLIGCKDPDCWGYCYPTCPPRTTPDWPNDWPAACSTDQPYCGDGVCNTFLEDARLCPTDNCDAIVPVCGDFHCDSPEDIANCPGSGSGTEADPFCKIQHSP